MRIFVFAALIALAGCGRLATSPFNPLTWFGGSVEVVGEPQRQTELRPLVRADQFVTVIDRRVPIERVDSLSIERTASGGLVRATGTAATQGFFNAELVPVASSGGSVTYEFRVEPPTVFEATGAEPTRRITAATELTAGQLAGIRAVRVQGRTNAREAFR